MSGKKVDAGSLRFRYLFPRKSVSAGVLFVNTLDAAVVLLPNIAKASIFFFLNICTHTSILNQISRECTFTYIIIRMGTYLNP